MDTENTPHILSDSTEELYIQVNSSRNLTPISLPEDNENVSRRDSYISSDQNPEIHIYKRRWYILFVFCLFTLMQSYMNNVWPVIAVSVHAAFGWSYAEISLMQNWFPVLFVITVFPMTWLLDSKGIRISIILSAVLLVVGSVLRCISMQQPYVTWLNNIANIVLAVSQPIAFILPPEISSTWFPANERTTATSIGVVIGSLGWSFTFLIEPSVVISPNEAENSNCTANSSHSKTCYTNLNDIRSEITIIRVCEAVLCGTILLMILIYFPSKPTKPPSPTAGLPKYRFFNGLKSLFM